MIRKSMVHAGVTLGGAALISAAMVAFPAGANDLQRMGQYFGVTSCSSSTPCIGGINSGSGPGVEAEGKSGVGLKASSVSALGIYSTSGKNNGIRGDTQFKSGGGFTGFAGVAGYDDSKDGGLRNSGIYGSSTSGTGVTGISQNYQGVFGHASNGSGVVGSTGGGPAYSAGVVGNDLSSAGEIGVLGESSAGQGMWALSQSGDGLYATSYDGSGINATSTNGDGVVGYSSNKVGVSGFSYNNIAIGATSANGNAVQTIQAIGGTSAAGGYSIATFNRSMSPTFVMDNAGNAHISGLIYTGGSCSSGCSKTGNGPAARVERYVPQEAAPTIEDVGEAQLSNGEAHVRLDPAFANVIDGQAAYVVFVTPEGPSRGLYVANKTAAGFEVAENPGGHSTVAFSYRIVAKPFGVNAGRLPYVMASQLPVAIKPTAPMLKQPLPQSKH